MKRALPELLLLLAAGSLACRQPDAEPPRKVPGGDPETGRRLLADYACGACHFIPGVPGAVSWSGPPLTAFGQRGYIAGRLRNEPEHLVAWIMLPKTVDPETAMPALGVTEPEARHMAAYLYTLRPGGLGPPRAVSPSWLHRLGELGPL